MISISYSCAYFLGSTWKPPILLSFFAMTAGYPQSYPQKRWTGFFLKCDWASRSRSQNQWDLGIGQIELHALIVVIAVSLQPNKDYDPIYVPVAR